MGIDYKKKYEFQKRIISRQSKQIENLKSQIIDLEVKCKEKDEVINSIDSLRNELTENIKEYKKQNLKYGKLIKELNEMKSIMNLTVFKGKWRLIKFLIK